MIVVDTSAIIAILGGEPDADSLKLRLAASTRAVMSAVNFVEVAAVAQRWGDIAATEALDQFADVFDIKVRAADEAIARTARDAYLKYGKGRGHPAHLNICDCFAYALAKTLDAPLLFKGDDFSKTDIAAEL